MAEWDRDSNEEESESDHSDLFDDLNDFDFSFMESGNDENGASCSATEISKQEELKRQLAHWSCSSSKILQTHVTGLLHILHPWLPFLPKDVRTLKKSIRKVTDIKDVPPGRYYHFGLVQGFITVLEHHFDLNNWPNLMEIYISFDGMPLTNSAKKNFVPVTATLVNIITYFELDLCAHSRKFILKISYLIFLIDCYNQI